MELEVGKMKEEKISTKTGVKNEKGSKYIIVAKSIQKIQKIAI